MVSSEFNSESDMDAVDQDLTNMLSVGDSDIKKAFYAACLAGKLKLNTKDPAQYVSVSDLYNKMVRKNVPVNMWKRWIDAELQAANRRFEKLKKRATNSGNVSGNISRRNMNMHIIEEEESDQLDSNRNSRIIFN